MNRQTQRLIKPASGVLTFSCQRHRGHLFIIEAILPLSKRIVWKCGKSEKGFVCQTNIIRNEVEANEWIELEEY